MNLFSKTYKEVTNKMLNKNTASTQDSQANSFNAIRYFLALLVLYSHSYGLLTLPEPTIFFSSLGNFAVKSFFALSGYFIALSCLRTDNLGHYLWNRALRITPALLVALIASHYIGKYFNNFIYNPVPYILNGPIWTLSWEVFCYFVLGFLMWYALLNKKSLGALLAVSWLLFIIFPFTNDYIIVIAPLILLFFSGAYIALNKENFNLNVIGPFFFILLLLINLDSNAQSIQWFFNHIVFLYGPNYGAEKYLQVFYLFSLPFALLWLGKIKLNLFSLRNDYSYGIYIYAWPIQQVIIAYSIQEKMNINPLVLFFLSWLFTHIIAMFSWHVIEKKALFFKY
jgi:peptidoglycan/LPS O-acetylase OafA/YrhL